MCIRDRDYIYDGEEVNMRPAVYVGFDNVMFERQVLGDSGGYSEDNSTAHQAGLSKTNLILRHISPSPDLSYALADTSAEYYLALTHMLQRSMPALGDFRLNTISKIQMIDPDRERSFRVDVVFSLVFMFAWNIVSEDQRLKDIVIDRFDTV